MILPDASVHLSGSRRSVVNFVPEAAELEAMDRTAILELQEAMDRTAILPPSSCELHCERGKQCP